MKQTMATSSNTDEMKAITEQRVELMNAKTQESDFDFAYSLQLQEAMLASLSLLPSSSSSPPPPPPIELPKTSGKIDGDVFDWQSKELEKLKQERRDRELSEIEARRLTGDLSRRIHDQKFAIDVLLSPEDDWDDYGDLLERPFGEGSSSSSVAADNSIFRLYAKGLVSSKSVGGSEVTLTGIGIAICDSRDNLIFQLSKPLVGNGMSRQITEIKALIEGLETAVALDLKRIRIFCDYLPLYQYVRHVWQPKQRKVAMLMGKVDVLRKKFKYSRPSLVPRNVIKFAFKLARDAIAAQISRPAESNLVENLKETCVICLEETDQDKMFTIEGCLHKYCFSCMRQYVDTKLHYGMIPKCPHESCKNELNINSCEKFLTPKLIEIMKQRIREASIPVGERVYCPYPRCSALMSTAEASDFAKKEIVYGRMHGAGKCLKCHGRFCVHCKAPWHKSMTCAEYKRSHPQPEDEKLKSLATRNLWRQCVKCNHMIELAEGCYHMTCRCGYEFCYTCGAEWKNKKATCSCLLWDEANILFEDTDFDEDDYDDDDDDDEDDDDEYDYYSDSDSD